MQLVNLRTTNLLQYHSLSLHNAVVAGVFGLLWGATLKLSLPYQSLDTLSNMSYIPCHLLILG